MTFTGFNFRNSLAFTTDPANTVFVGNVDITPYNPVSNGGTGYGYSTGTGSFTRNYSASVDGRIGGTHQWSGTNQFRVDIPAGKYKVRLAAGFMTTAGGTNIRLHDGNTLGPVLVNISNTSVPVGSTLDANNQIWTTAAWPGNNQTVNITSTQGFVTLEKGPDFPSSYIAHFAYEPISEDLRDVQLTDDTGVYIETTATTVAGNSIVSIVTPIVFTGNINANSSSITAVSNTYGMLQYMPVFGDTIAANNPAYGTISGNTLSLSFCGFKNYANTYTSAGTGSTFYGLPWFPGYYLNGANFPAGGSKIVLNQDGTHVVVESANGITSGTNQPVFVTGGPLTLYEKSPKDKIIGMLRVGVGPQNFTVTESDGTTPSAYITTRLLPTGQTALCYTATPMPGLGGSYSFKVIQTDPTSFYTASPHATSFTLPVVAAPTKPTDDSILAKISTPAFLLRKKVVDFIQANKWPGYQGQAFANVVIVNSLASLFSTMQAFHTQANTNRGAWYNIRLTSNGSGNYTTGYSGLANGVNFWPELGGGCLVNYNPGFAPLVSGNINTNSQRGVEWDGIIMPSSNTNSLSVFRVNTAAGAGANVYLNVVNIKNCKLGYLFNANNSESNFLTDYAATTAGPPHQSQIVNGGTNGQQLWVSNTQFWGGADSMLCGSTWLLEIDHCDVRFLADDFIRTSHLMPPGFGGDANLMPSFANGSFDNYVWIHDNTLRHIPNFPQAWPYSGISFNYPHGDHNQQQTNNFPPTSPIQWRVVENEVDTSVITATQMNQEGTRTSYFGRQFVIQSGSDTQYNVYINNISAAAAPRGIEFGNGLNYAEYNTLMAPIFPPSTATDQFYPQQDFLSYGNPHPGSPMASRVRKNICPPRVTGAANPGYRTIYNEDNAGVTFRDGNTANSIMQGPFFVDATETVVATGRIAYDFVDDGKNTVADHRKKWFDICRPKVDAGAQNMSIKLAAGEGAYMNTKTANTLSIQSFKGNTSILAVNAISVEANNLSFGNSSFTNITIDVI